MKPAIQTWRGHLFNYVEPEKNIVRVDDIAHALSHICRFAGHCNQFYSVAQHSVLVSRAVPRRLAKIGLLHDAAEAYMVDIPTPLKQLLPDYKAIEKRVEKAVLNALGLDEGIPDAVKIADLVLLATERRDLMNECDDSDFWSGIDTIDPLADRIVPLNSADAEILFMARYAELTLDD